MAGAWVVGAWVVGAVGGTLGLAGSGARSLGVVGGCCASICEGAPKAPTAETVKKAAVMLRAIMRMGLSSQAVSFF